MIAAAELPRSFGPYRILRRLGEGAQGQVYLAHEPASDGVVALKVVPLPADAELADAARARFLAEAGAARKLVHPHIAGVLAAGAQPGLAWLAMDYAPGVSLRRYAHPRRLLPEPLVLHVGHCLAMALAAAHTRWASCTAT